LVEGAERLLRVLPLPAAVPLCHHHQDEAGRNVRRRTLAAAAYARLHARHATELEELDVEGILAFAERVLPSAANLWVQASLDQKHRLQRLFFPDGVGFDGKRLVRTGVTLPAFNYLAPADGPNERVVDLTRIELVTS
jgi:hypothetical protein